MITLARSRKIDLARAAKDRRRRKCFACSGHRRASDLTRLARHGCVVCPWVEGILARADCPREMLLYAAKDDCKHPALLNNPRLGELAHEREFRQATGWGVFHWVHGLLTHDEAAEEGPAAHAVAGLLGRPLNDSPTGYAFLHRLAGPGDWYAGFEKHPDRLALLRPVLAVLVTFGHRPVLAEALGLL